jgi:hypothetical protein
MADIPGDATTRAALPLGQRVTGTHEFDDDADWYRVQLKGGTNYTFRAVAFDARDGEYAFETVRLHDAQGRVITRSFSDDYDGYVGGFDFRPSAGGTFFLAVEGDEGDGHRVAFEIDEPAAPPTSATVRPGQSRQGDFFSSGDEDTFSVRLEQGRAYDIALTRAGDAALDILDASGRVLFESDELDEPAVSSSFPGGTRALVEDFRAPYTGTFHLRAETFAAGPGEYTLAVEADPAAGPFDPAAPPSAEDDLLLGGQTAGDRLDALAGDDLVLGRGGNDDLQGGDGSDAVLGGDGKDFVYGGKGDDRLYGQGGTTGSRAGPAGTTSPAASAGRVRRAERARP